MTGDAWDPRKQVWLPPKPLWGPGSDQKLLEPLRPDVDDHVIVGVDVARPDAYVTYPVERGTGPFGKGRAIEIDFKVEPIPPGIAEMQEAFYRVVVPMRARMDLIARQMRRFNRLLGGRPDPFASRRRATVDRRE